MIFVIIKIIKNGTNRCVNLSKGAKTIKKYIVNNNRKRTLLKKKSEIFADYFSRARRMRVPSQRARVYGFELFTKTPIFTAV